MSSIGRRRLMTMGATAVGAAGVAAAAKLAGQYGLIPPDGGSIYGPGRALTYASHRLLTGDAFAREFRRDQIATNPFANGRPPKLAEFQQLEAGAFADWRLAVEGQVARPLSLSIAELRKYPARSQITQLTCEEGWSFVAEWTGVALGDVLTAAGMLPQAKYVVYSSIQPNWRHSIDLPEALHPQTLVTYGMNGGDLPVPHGGPVRLRVPRQLGYKSGKYITRLTVTDSLEKFLRKSNYAWYAGI